jgi:hypothetical protein
MTWYLAVLKNYASFRGRARRREYWMFVLVNAHQRHRSDLDRRAAQDARDRHALK